MNEYMNVDTSSIEYFITPTQEARMPPVDVPQIKSKRSQI